MASVRHLGSAPRVLVLTKRQYMSKDLIDDRYGRFRELPLGLAGVGCTVEGVCLSYRPRESTTIYDGVPPHGVNWRSRSLASLLTPRHGYWTTLDSVAEHLAPDVVWACSDAAHAVLGVLTARRLRCKLVIDLYDNFEAYPLARLPGVVSALRWAVGRADGVTCVSEPLADYVREAYGFRGHTCVIENAVPAGMFAPGDKATLRAELGLPSRATLVGTAGALSKARGTQYLFAAFLELAKKREDVVLVLAGPLDPSLAIPSHPRVRYLGLLAAEKVPRLLAALDLSVICNLDSEFGRYCFPQKLYESLASGTTVAVARVGAMARLLRDYPTNCFEPESAGSLLRTIESQLMNPVFPAIPVQTWHALAGTLSGFLGIVTDLGPATARA